MIAYAIFAKKIFIKKKYKQPIIAYAARIRGIDLRINFNKNPIELQMYSKQQGTDWIWNTVEGISGQLGWPIYPIYVIAVSELIGAINVSKANTTLHECSFDGERWR